MKKILFGSRKRVVGVVLTIAALVGAVAAYAYFTASGTGTGSAQTGKSAALTVKQIGAGYDTLIPGGSYHQDQCFACAQVTELGDDVTLANPGAQRLVSVTVAFRNWGDNPITNLPITLTIDSTTNGAVSATQNFSFDPHLPTGRPSVKEITFDLTAQSWFVQQHFVYGLSYAATGDASGLNVALSSSAINEPVGTETHPGTIWIATTAGAGIAGDFPTCTPGTAGVFASVTTNCGPSAAGNPGAYGNNIGPASADADVPAIEFNVVGGVAPGLTPGGAAQPVEFAIVNPGSTPVHVNQIATTVASLSNTGSGPSEACATSMYNVTGSPAAVNLTAPSGTTIVPLPSGTKIAMADDGQNQDNCQGATVNLAFAAS